MAGCYAVVCVKSDGRGTVFNVYVDQAEAERCRDQLVRVGCPCELRRVRRGTVGPGSSIKPRQRAHAE